MTFLLATLLIATNYLCWLNLKNQKLHIILSLSTWIHIILWYTVPISIMVIYQENTPTSDMHRYGYHEITKAMLIETASVLSILILIFFSKSSNKKNISQTSLNISKNSKKIIIFLFIVGIFLIYNSISSSTYLENNSAELYSGLSIQNLVKYIVHTLLLPAIILILIYEKKKSLILTLYSLIALYSIIMLLSGGRFHLLIIFIVFIIRGISKFDAKFAFSITLTLAFLYLVIIPIVDNVSNIRKEEISAADIINIEYKNMNKKVVTNLMLKLDSFSPSITLTKEDGLGVGGYMPYIGSALVFIPRTVMPSRPVAGSKDGTIYGHPSRLASRLAGYESDSQNEGISPAHISMWQFGYAGIFLFIISVYFYIKFIDKLLISKYFTRQVLGISMISIPTFHTLIQSPDALLKTTIVILSLIVIIRTYTSIKALGKHKKHNIKPII